MLTTRSRASAGIVIAALLIGVTLGAFVLRPRSGSAGGGGGVAGFSRAVLLSHVNSPAKTPGFPGDPVFTLNTVFTVQDDGFYLQVSREGEHTGTHYSAPCHFHAKALCAPALHGRALVLPAVVIDIRAQVATDPDYAITVQDLMDWETANGPMPGESAVLALTGCDAFWGPESSSSQPNYYNCGTQGAFHQPGFSLEAVQWLVDGGVLAERGALGTDTFGPDPGTDASFLESDLALRRHRMTLENLTNLDQLPAVGAWIVVGGARNTRGSGAPGTIVALVP
jgi:kynurenine formamidase